MLATTFEVGSRLEVEDGGVWYPVRVTHQDEDRLCIHFEGWSQRYDRWIDKDSENIRVLRKQHTMKRRSRAAEDEKPAKRSSTTLKVGGVFLAGARKSNRKSADGSKDLNRAPPAVVPETPSTPVNATSTRSSTNNQNAKIAKEPKDPKESKEPKEARERVSSRIRDSKEKETKNNPVAAPSGNGNKPATPVASPAPATAAAAGKVAPPVGWAYEVVTSAQDLVPKKAFIINEDHNDYKCTQENCNKSFRKEKLLQSHLKHYHNISIETNDAPPSTPTTPISASATPTIATATTLASNSTPITSAAGDVKRRRPPSQGRRTRNAAEDQQQSEKVSKDVTLDALTETSSSTDISNVTVIDTVETTLQEDLKTAPPSNETSPKAPNSLATSLETSPVASSQVPSATETNPISAVVPLPRTPLYGRVGQNRFVPIPEPLVLGREKRKIVKTERMQEAESAFIKKPKIEVAPGAADKKEKRRRSQGGDKEHTDEQQDVSLAKAEPPSDDEATISSPKSSLPPEPKGGTETLVEKDMVHCPCGVEEESGLMMQCDLCLCWQHGSCFGLENEKHVPERYVCIACQNARRVIQKQSHQVAAFRAMSEGRLPSLVPGFSGHPQRFLNLTKIAETMSNLRQALRGVEIRILRVYQDTNRSLPERRILLDAAVADSECIQRQMEICERILAAIDRPANDQGSEALILRSTVKSVLKDLWTVQRLTLFK